MNKIGKWTGIALIGASVIALDSAVLYVGAGAAREFLASPEAHAFSVATRVVGRALLHQAVGGAMRVADDLHWVGLRGAPEALAAMGLESHPVAVTCGVWCDRSTERQIAMGQRDLARIHRQLMADRMRIQIQDLSDQAREREQASAAERDQMRQQTREQMRVERQQLLEHIRLQREMIRERMKDSRETI